MAFSLRKMLTNMNYFKKTDECDANSDIERDNYPKVQSFNIPKETSQNINFQRTEADSTSKQQATSLKLPETLKKNTSKKGSLSDTDVLTVSIDSLSTKKEKRQNKKLKLDVKKAMSEALDQSDDENSSNNTENTPKHILLDSKSSDVFKERLKNIDFDRSFDIYDELSDEEPPSPYDKENSDLDSISSESDISIESNTDIKTSIKMCRKVTETQVIVEDNKPTRSLSLESFNDVELDKNEEERLKLLLNYQMKIEKLDCFLNKLLNEFQFHVDVSKIFHCRSVVTPLPGTDMMTVSKVFGDIKFTENLDKISRGPSPTGSWNIVIEKEDVQMKLKLKKQLLSIKKSVENFIDTCLEQKPEQDISRKSAEKLSKNQCLPQKRLRINNKKKIKHFDFPDFRDALTYLFITNAEKDDVLSDFDESELLKCSCRSQNNCSHALSDSGLTSKTNDGSLSNQSITSSIGNFSLDTTTLSAYSESLDQIISYNSFQDSSFYMTLLQKPAVERITFYVQVHSIQLNSEINEQDYESKNVIKFYCPACLITVNEENGLLNHILSQKHCEKIHFLYKTAYIKKCVSNGKEIQPSTILNPMKMYRDDNKIVCFGDAVYACSLCFENQIVGESVLMAHCSDPKHMDRRERMWEIVE